ncbi:MAG TPA: hypothetical protein VII68_17790 [Casimicrobiaceae bacterium]|jgi:hypothetical protein
MPNVVSLGSSLVAKLATALDAPATKVVSFCKNRNCGVGKTLELKFDGVDVDGYRWLDLFVKGVGSQGKTMDDVTVGVVFKHGQFDLSGALADFSVPGTRPLRPAALKATSGPSVGGFGAFFMRVPVIAPKVFVNVHNPGPQSIKFTVLGYLTR